MDRQLSVEEVLTIIDNVEKKLNVARMLKNNEEMAYCYKVLRNISQSKYGLCLGSESEKIYGKISNILKGLPREILYNLAFMADDVSVIDIEGVPHLFD